MTSQIHRILHALHVRYFHPAHVDRSSRCRLAESSTLLAPSSTLCVVFLVCSQVEGNEEQEVGRDYSHARKCSEFFTRALTGGR